MFKMVVHKSCVFLVLLLTSCVICEDEREKAAAIGIDEDEKIPISEHEFPKENVATRPDYKGKGHWATPAPDSGIELGFVPIKLYTQVRRSISVKHLPRSEALASATTPEEVANAPRLKEVVSTKKISEVYSEEGYEDSAYDHGGFAKEAENHEGYEHQGGGKQKRMSKRKHSHLDDSESQGSDSNVKEVKISGEPLQNETQGNLRRKLMRNATLLTFIENQGDEAVPSKVMASFTHTVEHPIPAPIADTNEQEISVDQLKLVTKQLTPAQVAESPHYVTANTPLKGTTAESHTYLPVLPYNQYTIPVLFMPTEVKQISTSTINNYDILRQHLYGKNFKDVGPLDIDSSFHINSRKILDTQEKTQDEIGFNSTPPPKQLSSDESLLTIKPTESQEYNFQSSLPTLNEKLISTNAETFYTGYQRKHPSISIEGIQRLEKTTTPVIKIIEGDNDKITDDMQKSKMNYMERRIEIQTQEKNQDVKHQNSHIPVLPSTGSTKLDDLNYRHKYKDISDLRNMGDGLNKTHIQRDSTMIIDKQILQTTKNNLQNHEVEQKTISDNTQPLKLEYNTSMLPLWAKFIEALNFGQNFKQSNKDNHPRSHSKNEERIPVRTDDSKTLSSNLKANQKTNVAKENHYIQSSQNWKENKTNILNATDSSYPNISQIVQVIKDAALEHVDKEPKHLVIGIVTLNSQDKRDDNKFFPSYNNTNTLQQDNIASASTSHSQVVQQPISRRTDENNFGNPQYLSADDEEKKLQLQEILLEEEKDRELQKNVNEWNQALQYAEKGIVLTPQVDTRKYPFYYSLPSNVLSVHSPLRYATNPKDIPRKTEGGMEFYDSREDVYCPEITGPKNVVPKRKSPGEWNKRPKPRLPRLRGLGDKIDCMRTKYFGRDPLDNPFFKEETVNIPRRADSIADVDSFGFYADIMEHIRNIGETDRIPFQRENTRETSEHQIVKPTESESKRNQYANSGRGNNNSKHPREEISSQFVSDSGQNENYSPSHIAPILSHTYRNITHNSIIQTPGLYVHPTKNDKIKKAVPESGKHYITESDVTGSLPPAPDISQNHAYRNPYPEIILGMVPPPVPTPKYLIIKTVTRSPKVLPTSILTLLSDNSIPNRHKRIPVSHDYNSLHSFIPPVRKYYSKSSINNDIGRQNGIKSATTQDTLGIRNIHRRMNERNNIQYGNVTTGDNSDLMVAEESTETEKVLYVEGLRTSLPNEDSTVQISLRHRARRSTSRRRDESEEDKPRRSQRKISNEKRKPKTNRITKESAGIRNTNNLRRRIDHEDDVAYQYYEGISNPTVRTNGKNNRRQGIREGHNDGRHSSDFAATVDYGITHDRYEPDDQLQSYYTDVKPKKPSKKIKSKPRDSGSNSRRGEPRYYDDNEEDKVITKHSRNRGNKGDNGTKRNNNSDIVRPINDKVPKKVSKTIRKLSSTSGQSCTSEMSCLNAEKEILNKSPGVDDGEKNESDVSIENEEIKPKYSAKTTSKGFEISENESNDTSEDKSKNNELLVKLKSKYPDGLMSAEQINKILGGFMSRHNPSYSSKYNEEDIQDMDATTTATLFDDNNTTEPNQEIQILKETKNRLLTTEVKNIKKVRVVPILNSKVIPELITSTQKPQDSVKERKLHVNRAGNISSEIVKHNRRKNSDSGKKYSRSRNNSSEREENVEQTEVGAETQGDSPIRDTYRLKDTKYINRRQKMGIRDRGNGVLKTSTVEETNKSNKRNPISTKVTEEKKNIENHDQKEFRNSLRINRINRKRNETQNPNSLNASKTQPSESEETEENNSTTPVTRRLHAIEHRRVTKEEVYKTTYFPEDELIAEMEKQSELDVAELEDDDESGEKIKNVRREEEEDDFYEPYESYNYETKHPKHPGNRLQHENNGNADINRKRGYYIVHEPDNYSPQQYVRPPKRNNFQSSKENSNFSSRKTYENKDNFTLQRNPEKDEFTTASTLKARTKDGVKGFYIQKPINSTLDKREKIKSTKQILSEELTYYVNPKTGLGEWIASTDEKKFIRNDGETEDISDYTEQPAWTNVRNQRKNTNGNNRKVNKTSSDVSKNSKHNTKSKNENTKKDKEQKVNENKRRSNVNSKKGFTRTKKNNTSLENIDEHNINYDLDRNSTKFPIAKRRDIPKPKKERTSKRRNKESLDQDKEESISNEEYRNVEDVKDDYVISDYDDYDDRYSRSRLETSTKPEKIYVDERNQRLHKNSKTNFKDRDINPNYSSSEKNYYEHRKNKKQPTDSSGKVETNYSEEDVEIIENKNYEEIVTTEDTIASNERRQSNNSDSKDDKTDRASLTEGKDTKPKFIKHPGERKYYYVDDFDSKKDQFLPNKRKSRPERRNHRSRAREETEDH